LLGKIEQAKSKLQRKIEAHPHQFKKMQHKIKKKLHKAKMAEEKKAHPKKFAKKQLTHEIKHGSKVLLKKLGLGGHQASMQGLEKHIKKATADKKHSTNAHPGPEDSSGLNIEQKITQHDESPRHSAESTPKYPSQMFWLNWLNWVSKHSSTNRTHGDPP